METNYECDYCGNKYETEQAKMLCRINDSLSFIGAQMEQITSNTAQIVKEMKYSRR